MEHNKPHAHRLRKGRHSQPGQVYMITVVTADRQRVFDDFSAASVLIGHLKNETDLQRASTLAYVLMPDHLHWLMQLMSDAPLSQTVRAVKSLTTHQLGHPIWQRGYHDHAVRNDEDLKAMARYIIANPVRAGLVSSVADYPHWDAMWL
jgi:REP element-mobilizing transposase RayT